MVLRQSAMNDEEDLEALRLAALQTIRPRFPKVPAPFIRPSHNPNLIAIVPTGPVASVHLATNGSSSSAKKQPPAPISRVSPIKESSVAKQEEHLIKKEKKIERIKLDLDEDVLDFEGDNEESEEKSEEVVEEEDDDAVALHADDEDSLEKLMDKMEEELSEKPVKKNVNSIIQKKEIVAVTNGQEKIVQSIPPTTTVLTSTISASTSINISKARSRSPIPLRRRSRSPYAKKWSPRSRSRSRSPRPRMRSHSRTRSKSPVPRRRSSRSPLRGRSRSPPPRRGLSRSRSRSRLRLRSRTRSPVFRRSRTPPKYARRSPPRNARRSRSRSRSWPSPRRDYRSPPRRPIIARKRSPSPGRRSLSCERKFRRSASPRKRSLSPAPEKCRRKRSPLNSHRRHHGSTGKRSSPSKALPQRSHRVSPSCELKSSPPSKVPNDNLPSLLDLTLEKKTSSHTSSPNRNASGEPTLPIQSSNIAVVDSKLEARRRKFESTALVAALPKKIRLKATSHVEESADIAITTGELTMVQGVIKEKLEADDAKVQAVVEAVVRQLQRQKPANSGDSSKETRRLISLHSKRGVVDRVSEVKKEKEPDKPKPSAVRFTVADAEKEIRQLKLKKRQIVDLDGVEEEITDVALVEKHKRNKKKKKKEKKEKKEAALIESALLVETEAAAPSSVVGTDLRAEISRRRAERLKGQVKGEAIVRIVQSAFEGVVGKKKVKKSAKGVAETEDEWPKSTGGRRVQLLQPHQKLYSKSEKCLDINEDEDSDVEETEGKVRKGGSGIGSGSSSTSTATSGNAFRGILQ